MHLKLFTCMVASIVAPAFAAEGWMANIEKAQEVATKEKKSVFVEFTGSDWCPPCINLKKTVFDSEDFKKLAKEKLVTVELDYPRGKELPAEQKKYNDEMSKKYAITGFPTAILMDEKGTTFWMRIGGAQDKGEYIKEIESALEKKKEILGNLEKANSAEGLEKAKLLDKALKDIGENAGALNPKIADEIIALDKEDTLGYGNAKRLVQEDEALRAYFTKELNSLVEAEKYDEAIAKVEEYAAKDELLAETRQKATMTIFQFYMMKKDIDKALENAEKALKIDESTESAKRIKLIIEQVKKNREQIEKQMKEAEKL